MAQSLDGTGYFFIITLLGWLPLVNTGMHRKQKEEKIPVLFCVAFCGHLWHFN